MFAVRLPGAAIVWQGSKSAGVVDSLTPLHIRIMPICRELLTGAPAPGRTAQRNASTRGGKHS